LRRLSFINLACFKLEFRASPQDRDQGVHVDVTQLEITTDLALVITKLPGMIEAKLVSPAVIALLQLTPS
jgi:hypothetical protein